MKTYDKEMRITYIGPEGKAFWHGKLATLKETHKFVQVIRIEPITQEIYGDT